MSGSTENLLRNSHLSTSKESLDGHYYETQSPQKNEVNEHKTQGIENEAFQDDHRGPEPTSAINYSYEPESYQKRASSSQQKPMASSLKEPRRHSSPDHSGHLRPERNRLRHGGRRRLSSNIEEDLRRKACLNSMKRHHSANPLPGSRQEEYDYVSSAVPDKKQSYIEDMEKIQNLDKERSSERSLVQQETRNQREPPFRYDSSRQQDNEVQNMQQTIIALEKNQLEQYKKRLTLALSERAKLTEELQMLSQSLTPREMETDRHSSESVSLGSSLGRSSSLRSPRLSHSLGDLRVPEMYGDYGDISVDYENKLRLPPVPGSAQTSRKKMEIPELDLRSLNSSFERVSSDHMENPPKEKEIEKDKETQLQKGGGEGNSENSDDENEELKKMVDDIWQDNLRGDVLAEARKEEKSKDDIADKNTRDSDVNNNEKTSKKRLTVEEFLTNGDSKEKPKEKTQQQRELNILQSYENMNGVLRQSSPELYEPVENLFRYQPLTQENEEKKHQNPTDYTHRLKADDEKSRDEGTLENYHTASTLPVEKREKRREVGDDVRGKGESNLKRGEATLNYENELPSMTRTGRNERRFNYMVPPGARMVVTSSENENLRRNEKEKATEREIERVPSNISDKLRYYRAKLANRVEEEPSRDLADAYAREKDPEKRREIQRQAAGEAAILRREASALLFEAMNLERICDANGRVRHVYYPH